MPLSLQVSLRSPFLKGEVNAAEHDHSTELWHKRLGHLSEKGLKILAKKELLPNVTGTLLKACTHSLAGKHRRLSFQTFPP